ncbi:unnamed protein product [Heligmosomoides polygyrus]|uniref:PKcGMP_CC domain-containing protein n=1 Tax=Heligmosomoides polygyrus TaxID=6339 RepID=A0A183FU62_HELPZ|nr:unnamed protein product [Heligmosomoides polygyrus]
MSALLQTVNRRQYGGSTRSREPEKELEEEFRRLCGNDANQASLQEQLSAQIAELEELRAMKKEWALKEEELLRLQQKQQCGGGQFDMKVYRRSHRSRCVHASVFAGLHTNGIMRHSDVCGWLCKTSRIFELGWSRTTWTGPDRLIGKEHRRILLLLVSKIYLHRLKFAAGGAKDQQVFFYREFGEVHLKKTNLFDNNIGHVIFVFSSVEPKPRTWLPVVHTVNMWTRCGVRLYN